MADLNTEAGRAQILAACPEPDILVNNNAGPEPGKIADWSREDWLAAVEANMLAPIFLIKALCRECAAARFGRIINITSAMVKSPSATMGLSAAVRAGVTALSKSVQRDSVVDNVTINNLLPERFDTDRQRYMAERMVKKDGITMAEAKAAHRRDDCGQATGRPEGIRRCLRIPVQRAGQLHFRTEPAAGRRLLRGPGLRSIHLKYLSFSVAGRSDLWCHRPAAAWWIWANASAAEFPSLKALIAAGFPVQRRRGSDPPPDHALEEIDFPAADHRPGAYLVPGT